MMRNLILFLSLLGSTQGRSFTTMYSLTGADLDKKYPTDYFSSLFLQFDLPYLSTLYPDLEMRDRECIPIDQLTETERYHAIGQIILNYIHLHRINLHYPLHGDDVCISKDTKKGLHVHFSQFTETKFSLHKEGRVFYFPSKDTPPVIHLLTELIVLIQPHLKLRTTPVVFYSIYHLFDLIYHPQTALDRIKYKDVEKLTGRKLEDIVLKPLSPNELLQKLLAHVDDRGLSDFPFDFYKANIPKDKVVQACKFKNNVKSLAATLIFSSERCISEGITATFEKDLSVGKKAFPSQLNIYGPLKEDELDLEQQLEKYVPEWLRDDVEFTPALSHVKEECNAINHWLTSVDKDKIVRNQLPFFDIICSERGHFNQVDKNIFPIEERYSILSEPYFSLVRLLVGQKYYSIPESLARVTPQEALITFLHSSLITDSFLNTDRFGASLSDLRKRIIRISAIFVTYFAAKITLKNDVEIDTLMKYDRLYSYLINDAGDSSAIPPLLVLPEIPNQPAGTIVSPSRLMISSSDTRKNLENSFHEKRGEIHRELKENLEEIINVEQPSLAEHEELQYYLFSDVAKLFFKKKVKYLGEGNNTYEFFHQFTNQSILLFFYTDFFANDESKSVDATHDTIARMCHENRRKEAESSILFSLHHPRLPSHVEQCNIKTLEPFVYRNRNVAWTEELLAEEIIGTTTVDEHLHKEKYVDRLSEECLEYALKPISVILDNFCTGREVYTKETNTESSRSVFHKLIHLYNKHYWGAPKKKILMELITDVARYILNRFYSVGNVTPLWSYIRGDSSKLVRILATMEVFKFKKTSFRPVSTKENIA